LMPLNNPVQKSGLKNHTNPARKDDNNVLIPFKNPVWKIPTCSQSNRIVGLNPVQKSGLKNRRMRTEELATHRLNPVQKSGLKNPEIRSEQQCRICLNPVQKSGLKNLARLSSAAATTS